MKAFTFNVNSWHYKLAKLGGLDAYAEDNGTDFCTYTRKFLNGLSQAFFLAAASIGIIAMFGQWIGWVAACISTGSMISPSEIVMIVNCILIVCAVLFGLFLRLAYMEKKADDPEHVAKLREKKANKASNPSFLRLWYRSFKQKTCFKVELK